MTKPNWDEVASREYESLKQAYQDNSWADLYSKISDRPQ